MKSVIKITLAIIIILTSVVCGFYWGEESAELAQTRVCLPVLVTVAASLDEKQEHAFNALGFLAKQQIDVWENYNNNPIWRFAFKITEDDFPYKERLGILRRFSRGYTAVAAAIKESDASIRKKEDANNAMQNRK